MSRIPKTTATKEEAKPALVPKVRFPEFRGAEGWKEKPLGKYLHESRIPGSKGNIARKITVKLWGNGVYEKKEAVQGSINTQYFRRKAGQFIYSKLDFLNQAFGIVPEALDGYESTVDLPCFDISEGLNPVFLLEYVKRKDFYERVGEAADGSRKAKRIQVETFLECHAALPTLPEQQKIAECLSSVDEVIAAQARKLDALKTHKKGLMQQLFPREGDTQPRLRFPEFQNAEEWEEVPLGELVSYQNGKAYEKDITETGKYVVVNSRFISTDGAVRKYTNADYLIAEAGEVLMVLSDLPKGKALAKCYFVEAIERYAVNQRVCRLTPKRIDGKFLYYALNRHPRLLAFDDGLNQTHLSKGGVTECPLCVPEEKHEQHRIATCLSSLDALIAAETQMHAVLQRHKRGLMQQLFPSPEEVEA